MGGISQDQYNRLDAILSDPDKSARMSPEVRAQAQAAVDGYKNQAAAIIQKVDPELPLVAQSLATQPASTHVDGDQAAADEWQRNPEGASKGRVFVYDAPLSTARKNILEHPEILPAMGYPRMPPSAEAIQAMDHDSPIYHSYNDYLWRQTADAAAQAGKTAYRYSKAPWLQDGGIMPALQGLGLKLGASLVPATEAANAFIMGEDDTATFGAIRKAEETADAKGAGSDGEQPDMPRKMGGAGAPVDDPENYERHPTLGWVKKGSAPKDEIVGGAIGTAQAEGGGQKRVNELAAEENPKTRIAGQVTGAIPGAIPGAVKGVGKVAALASQGVGRNIAAVGRGIESLVPWSASNALFDVVASGGKSGLAKWGFKEAAPVMTSAASAGLAGAAVNAAHEGVDAAANYAQTGDTGTTLGDAATRTAKAAAIPAGLGAAGSIVQQTAGGIGNWVREGRKDSLTGGRYQGVPGKLERAGLEPEFGRGYAVPEAVKAAQQEARQLEVPVEQVLAERVAPKLAEPAAASPGRQWKGGAIVEAPPVRAPKDPYPAVKSYARGKADIKTVRALNKAADRAGPEVAKELRATRVPALLGQLETLTSPAYKKVADSTLVGTAERLGDAALVRYAYPALRSLEGPLGPLGSGKAGRAGIIRGEGDKPEEDPALRERYGAWRTEYLKRKEAPKPRKNRVRP